MGTFLELGKAKEGKERDGLGLSSTVPKIQWDSTPAALTAIRQRNTFTFLKYYF